jgi:hypothetical protein
MGWCHVEIIHKDGSRTTVFEVGADPLADPVRPSDQLRHIEESDDWTRGVAGNPPALP